MLILGVPENKGAYLCSSNFTACRLLSKFGVYPFFVGGSPKTYYYPKNLPKGMNFVQRALHGIFLRKVVN